MTSFGWKRKSGQSVSKAKAQAFEANSQVDEPDLEASGIDWLTLAPSKRFFTLEDATAKSARLKQEGNILAEAERYWEAINKWDLALQLTPNNASLYEMKAQAYLQLNELLPAVSAAKHAVQGEPTWWSAHQTLGRAQLGLGEVSQALKSFSRAVHLNPCDEELWKEDLDWAHQLLKKHQQMKEVLQDEDIDKAKIVELDDDSNNMDKNKLDILPHKKSKIDTTLLLPLEKTDEKSQKLKDLRTLPTNMVLMRN